MTPLPIIAGQVALSTQTAVSTDTFCNGILTSIDNFARASTTAPAKWVNGLGMSDDGILSFVDATAGLPAGYTFSNGLPRDTNGALCVSTAVASTYSNGVPFAANSAVSALVSSMNLQFAGAATLDSRITFTRASSGTYVDPEGVLQTAGTNEARFTHDPVTLQPLGLMVEEARTNLLTYSEQFDDASWVKSAATVTANAEIAPDATLTMDKLVENTATVIHHIQKNYTFTATSHTYSKYAKAGERTWVRLGFADGTATFAAYFNLATGTVGTVAAGTTATITAFGNGVYRCFVTATTSAGAGYVRDWLSTGDGVTTYTGDGVSGVYLWGAQLEAGASVTSYIPTTTASATRAADVAAMIGTDFSSWFNATEGTFVCEWVLGDKNTTASIYQADDGTSSNVMRLRYNAGGTANDNAIINGGVTQATLSDATQLTPATYTNAMAYKLNDSARSADGAAVATDAACTIPAVTQLRIGGVNGTEVPNCTIKSIRYYATRISNAQLVSLSA